ncbi:MAG: dephospho-CoA kinase [Alphaproteobacteria bacterium]
MIRGRYVIGLTGSIGMGKSVAAGMLRRAGVPVFDADAEVHRLMGKGGRAVPLIEAAFPGVVVDGAVDRPKLGARVFGDAAALKRLERILHPMVGQGERAFLARAARLRRPIVARDVPLLFETGGDRRCDMTLVVSAPAHIQRHRVLARPGMTEERLAQVRSKQMPDARKRKLADRTILSGTGKRDAWVQIRKALRGARRDRAGRHG